MELPPPIGDELVAELAPDPTRLGVAFARVLRAAGLALPLSCTVSFADALAAVGVDRRDPVYWAGRATLIRRPEDIDLYDRAFAVFWDQARADQTPDDIEAVDITLAVDLDDSGDDGGDDPDDGHAGDEPHLELRFSAAEVLRHKDFAEYTDSELDEAQELMERLRLVGSPRRSLRRTAADRRTRLPDIRRTMRSAMQTAGEPIRRHYSDRRTRHRRLVLLLDVSGSMEPYARALLRFVHAAVAGRQRVEAFAIGTRLTRLTRELTSRDPDDALRRAAQRMADYGGGTRLGASLHDFNDQWAQRGMARGAIVVVMSDGWDRGDPDELAEQMQRLHRTAHRLIWVNPLKVTPGYAPLARGMAAALPHLDAFVEGHSLDAMERLATEIGR